MRKHFQSLQKKVSTLIHINRLICLFDTCDFDIHFIEFLITYILKCLIFQMKPLITSFKTPLMKWHLLFACCLSYWVLPAQSDSLNALAITDLVAAYAEARQNQDAQKISSLFTEDADQLVSSGVWRQGRAALVEGMLRSSQNNPGDRSLEVERIRFLSPTVAIADARYTIGQRKMWSTFLAVKSGEDWRLTAIRNMLPSRSN